MLYGMEEFDDEFGIIKKEKLNIKKVGIVISIIVIIMFVVFLCFVFSRKPKNNENNQLAIQGENENLENENQQENNTDNQESSKVIIENKENKKDNKDKKNIYEGNHIQIATHSIEMNLPIFNENAQKQIKDIYYSDEKQVYLTFDDGPSKDVTPKILDILKENDVKATFFVLGARVELYPNTLKREFEEGHYIANHGYSHQYSKIYENKDTTFQEYIDCENTIKNALGNQDYNSYLFRFPGGSSGGPHEKSKSEARELFKTYGIAYTNWNCLTGDAENKKTKEACMQEMIETKGNQNSVILLMHDANDKMQTVEALPEIIQYYKNEGYVFKNFYEIFQ